MNHEITHDTVVKKALRPRCPPFERAGSNAPVSFLLSSVTDFAITVLNGTRWTMFLFPFLPQLHLVCSAHSLNSSVRQTVYFYVLNVLSKYQRNNDVLDEVSVVLYVRGVVKDIIFHGDVACQETTRRSPAPRIWVYNTKDLISVVQPTSI